MHAASENLSIPLSFVSTRSTTLISRPWVSHTSFAPGPRRFTHHLIANMLPDAQSRAVENEVLMRKHAISFKALDKDGDDAITFEEFLAAMPARILDMRSVAEIRSWFDIIDADSSGAVTMDEFFRWSLSATSLSSGSGILHTFERYDEDRSGVLTEREFCKAAEEMGYGKNASELFEAFPTSNGTLNYLELLAQTNDLKTAEWKNLTRDFLCTMAWDSLDDTSVTVDTSGWTITAQDPEGLRQEVLALLTKHDVHLPDLFWQIDTSDDQRLCSAEFARAMRTALGYSGPKEVLDEVYKRLDADSSDSVSFEEVDNWIHKRSLLDYRITLSHRVRPEDSVWSVSRLKRELQRVLDEAHAMPADLFHVWDVYGSGSLSKRRCLIHFKRCAPPRSAHGARDCHRRGSPHAPSSSTLPPPSIYPCAVSPCCITLHAGYSTRTRRLYGTATCGTR